MVDTLPDRFYKTADVAKRFNVDRKTVVLWVEQGKLVPAMDIGNGKRRSWRFHPDDVAEFYRKERERCQRNFDRRKFISRHVRR